MEAAELVSLLLIVFFFFAAIFAPIIQQLRSAARQQKRAAARQAKKEGEAEEKGEEPAGGKRRISRARQAGENLLRMLRRERSGDRRETDAYRDLLREDEQEAHFRFTEGPAEEEPRQEGRSLGSLESAPPTGPPKPAAPLGRGSPGSSWTSSGQGRSMSGAGVGRSRPGGHGMTRIRSLPPLQRGVIMAELLGKPKALKEKPFDS